MAISLDKLGPANGFRIDGPARGDEGFGNALAAAGDLNGDGLDDLIIGAEYGGKFDAGRSYVVFGSTTGLDDGVDVAVLDGTSGFRIIGEDRGDRIGHSVSGAGDVNGDGIGDIILSALVAYTDQPAPDSKSYVIYGTAGGFEATVDLATLDGIDGIRLEGGGWQSYSSQAVAGAGDVNGDGLDDLIIDAAQSGEAYVVFGSAERTGAALDLAALDGGEGFRLDVRDRDGYGRQSVAGAGDVNGDGIDDLVVADSLNDVDGRELTGSTYVVFGDDAGFPESLAVADLDGNNGFRIDGVHAGDDSGASVSSAGDFNGDGVGDLIVGAPGASESYVVFGSDSGFAADFDLNDLDGDNGFRILRGSRVLERLGDTVASAGDMNGDGFDDLLVKAPRWYSYYYDDFPGAAFVLFGSATGIGPAVDVATLTGDVGFRIDPGTREDINEASAAGDVNGDGYDDVTISTRDNNSSYVVFGGAQLGGANDAPVAADDVLAEVRPGDVVDLAADHGGGLDRDGDFEALAITAINGVAVAPHDSVTLASGLRVAFRGGTEIRFHTAAVPLGTRITDSFTYEVSDGRGASDTATVSLDYAQNAFDLASLDGANGFTVRGMASSGWMSLGTSGAGVGDFNADGIDDLIVGAPSGGRTDDGRSYVVFGSAEGFERGVQVTTLDGTDGIRIVGENAHDYSGGSVSGAGDVNGDGIEDLLVGARSADPGGREGAGSSYVVFGRATGFDGVLRLASLDGSDGFRLDGVSEWDASGTSVAGAGDVNGDGIDDLVIGAPYAEDVGRAYVVFGSIDGIEETFNLADLDGSNGFRLNGVSGLDWSGTSVAGAGDVNGDGIDDLVIAARYAGAQDGGEAYVVFGSTDSAGESLDLADLDGSNGFRLDGGESGVPIDSVAGAGDVNGDGFDDVIVGGFDYYAEIDANYVVFGDADGFDAALDLSALDGTDGFRIEGPGGNEFGQPVAGAGDLNGDGIDDLIIGAPDTDRVAGSYDRAGESYVVFGDADGFGASLDVHDLDGTNGYRLLGREGDRSGYFVAAAGDVNEDGLDDLLIGAPGHGRSYVVFGSTTLGSSEVARRVDAAGDDFRFDFDGDAREPAADAEEAWARLADGPAIRAQTDEVWRGDDLFPGAGVAVHTAFDDAFL